MLRISGRIIWRKPPTFVGRSRPGRGPLAGAAVESAAALCLVAGTALGFAGTALGQAVPVPPCAGMPFPAPGEIGALLNQLVWIDDEVPEDWTPPSCTGWTPGPTKVLLAAAGRFRMDGDSGTMAARLAAISGLEDMVYWSSSRGRWRALFSEATALAGPDAEAPRADFDAADLAPGAALHYRSEEDNPTAGVVYRMLVHARTPDRLVIETVNVTPLRTALLILRRVVAAPGEFHQLYYFEREDGDVWRFYALLRMGGDGGLFGTSAENYRNRTEAYFRYLAGLPMTREPPAAR